MGFRLPYHNCYWLVNSHFPEPTIRMGVLGAIGLLLERNEALASEGDGFAVENEERLIDVPIRMLSDINQQVCVVGKGEGDGGEEYVEDNKEIFCAIQERIRTGD